MFNILGKPTVKLEGAGVGGRAQQLALQFAMDCDGYKLENINGTLKS